MVKRKGLRRLQREMVHGTIGFLEGHEPHMLDAAKNLQEVSEKRSLETVASIWTADTLNHVSEPSFVSTTRFKISVS